MTTQLKAIVNSAAITLKRWAYNKFQRTTEWQLSPLYWALIRKKQSTDFRFNKLIFDLRYRRQNTKESFRNLRTILSGILWPTIAAIAIISCLEFFEYQFVTYSESIYRFLHIPDWLSTFVSMMRSFLSKARDAYLESMSAISQIAAAFLGLYFATVGVVVSTVYARVPRNVRQLLVWDKLSNHYIKAMALLSASALLLMGSMAAGRQPGILNLLYIVLLGVYTIFSAVVLGLRILDFFDPTKLAFKLAADLMGWIDEATPKRRQWSSIHFQAYFQQQAENLLETYRDIIDLANREQHLQSNALSELTQNAFTLLRVYISQKHSIPSNSCWFKPTLKHRNWQTSGHSHAETALSTGTMLQPETTPDLMWFESEIEEVVSLSLNGLVSRQDLNRAYSFSNSALQALGTTAYSYSLDEALHLYQTLSPSLRKLSRSVDGEPQRADEITTRLKVALGLTDIYGLGFINILLRFSDRLRNLTSELLGEVVANIKWEQPGSIYSTLLPRQVIQQLEFLRQRLLFEREVEGKIISPLWYQQQLVALSFVRFIESATAKLLTELEEVFTKEVEALVKESRYLFAAQLITRGLEACNKFHYHFNEAKACVDRLGLLRRVEDIPWPVIKWEDYSKKINEVQERQIIVFGEITNHLATIPQTDQIPDYFGHAYSVLAEECYQALVSGNERLFEKLFPSFFSASLATHDQLFTAKVSHDPMVQFGITVQPLLDLFDLSGYAVIYSELYGKNFKQAATKLWDAYFSAVTDEKARAYMLCQKLNLHESGSGWMIYPRDLRRTTWQQVFEQVLIKEGIKESLFDYRWDEQKEKHPNKIIRVLSYGVLSYQAHDVFLALYLSERFGSGVIALPRQANEFLKTLNQENEKDEESLED